MTNKIIFFLYSITIYNTKFFWLDLQKKLYNVNVKMKMYKNADSKCTILAKPFEIEYNLSGSDENELQKRHLREGEIYAERKSGGKY